MTPLLEVRDLGRHYVGASGPFRRGTTVKAVDGVSFAIMPGETLGVVGESGCGKTTTGRLALGLERPDAGSVSFEGVPLPAPDTPAWRRLRARLQMVHQDPLGALDRRLTAAAQIREPLDIHAVGDRRGRDARVAELVAAVGLSPDHGRRHPHELSGGQRQRVVIARALATRPDLIVCDEPVSALDVSIQAQVVNLLVDLQASLGLALMFISHDLKVVRQVSRRILVMYLGRVVEEGDADTLFADPKHPYARALVSAAPTPGEPPRARIVLGGEPPDPAARPTGCAFHPRCPAAVGRCRTDDPALAPAGAGRRAACWRVGPDGSFA